MKKIISKQDHELFYAKFYLLFRLIIELSYRTIKPPFTEMGSRLVNMSEQMWQNFILFYNTHKVGYLLKCQAVLETISIELKLLLDEKQISAGHHLILIELISDLRVIINKYL